MSLVGSFILPHPPVMVPSVGGKEGLKPIEKTVSAMLQVAKITSKLQVDTVVIITPHGSVYPDRISIRMPANGKLSGDLSAFGSSDGLDLEADLDLADDVITAAIDGGIKVIPIDDSELDHGVLAPMFYVNKGLPVGYKLVSMNISFAGYKTHFDFGRVLRKVFDKSNKKILFIGSGDLSHALTAYAPCGYSKEGAKFDENPIENAKKALKVLSGIEKKLGGDYGIARYEPTKVELKDGWTLEYTYETLSEQEINSYSTSNEIPESLKQDIEAGKFRRLVGLSIDNPSGNELDLMKDFEVRDIFFAIDSKVNCDTAGR